MIESPAIFMNHETMLKDLVMVIHNDKIAKIVMMTN